MPSLICKSFCSRSVVCVCVCGWACNLGLQYSSPCYAGRKASSYPNTAKANMTFFSHCLRHSLELTGILLPHTVLDSCLIGISMAHTFCIVWSFCRLGTMAGWTRGILECYYYIIQCKLFMISPFASRSHVPFLLNGKAWTCKDGMWNVCRWKMNKVVLHLDIPWQFDIEDG